MLAETLTWLLPLFLYVDLALLLSLLWMLFDFKKVLSYVKDFPKTTILATTALLLSITFARYLPAQTHRIYYDEHIYLNIGQNIAETGKVVMGNHVSFRHGDYQLLASELNKEPTTFPFLVSIPFSLFGVNQDWGFVLNNLALVVGSLFVALIIRMFTPTRWVWMLGAAIHFLIPHNLIWSNTCAVEPVTSTFAVASVFCTLSYAMRPKPLNLYVSALVLAIAVQTRHDSMLLTPVVCLLLFLANKQIWRQRHFWLAALLFSLLCFPHFMHVWLFRNHSWGSSGPKFALSFVAGNLWSNAVYYVDNGEFPTIVTLLAVVGLFLPSQLGKYRWGFLLWFFLAWGIFIPFYAGSYRFGADVRFAVISFAPLSILSSFGALKLVNSSKSHASSFRKALLVFVALNLVMFFPLVRRVGREAWASRKDYAHAIDFAKLVPKDGLVLTHNPSIFILKGTNAAQMSILTYNPQMATDLAAQYPGGLYLHWNYWCNVNDELQVSFCTNILEKYQCDLLELHRDQHMRYALYSISLKEPQTSALQAVH